MATPTEPATDALYQALSSPEPDPKVVHAAIEEIRYLSGYSVIAAIEAKIDSQSARIDVKFSQIEVQITKVRQNSSGTTEMDTRLTRIEAEVKTQGTRIDDLRQVIWPLIVLLAVPVFGLLYKVLTS